VSNKQQGRIRLIETLRRITLAVKLFPFIYDAAFITFFALYSFFGKTGMADIINYLVFVSPVVVVAHLFYSKILKMCKWHRVACSLPILPQAVDLFDKYMYSFGHYEWIIVASTIILSMILFMIAIYKVFFTDEGRIC
jgi:hypothetical protein